MEDSGSQKSKQFYEYYGGGYVFTTLRISTSYLLRRTATVSHPRIVYQHYYYYFKEKIPFPPRSLTLPCNVIHDDVREEKEGTSAPLDVALSLKYRSHLSST